MQRCIRLLQLAGCVLVLRATFAVALWSVSRSDNVLSPAVLSSAGWLGSGSGSSYSCHAPISDHSSWPHAGCLAACWGLLLWQVLGIARRCGCVHRSVQVPAERQGAPRGRSGCQQQQQQPVGGQQATAGVQITSPPAGTAAAAAAAGGGPQHAGTVALSPSVRVDAATPMADTRHLHMLHLLRQLSECFTSQQVHAACLAKPHRSSTPSCAQPAAYSTCSEHMACSIKVYASWVHATWLQPLLLRSLYQALTHTGVNSSPAASDRLAPGDCSGMLPPCSSSMGSSGSWGGIGVSSWAVQPVVFRGCVHMLASAYRAKSVAAAAAAAAEGGDASPPAGADQDGYREQLLSRLHDGLQQQQVLPHVDAALGVPGRQQQTRTAGTGSRSNGTGTGVQVVGAVAGLRVLWQEQPALLADAAHRQLVVLHLGQESQQAGQLQPMCQGAPSRPRADPTHTPETPAAAAAGSSPAGDGAPDSGVGVGGTGMAMRVLVFGHQQVLVDVRVQLGPVLRVWMPPVCTGLYHLALLPLPPYQGASAANPQHRASAAPLLMHPLLALPGPAADELNRIWSTTSVLTGAVPRTVAALAAAMGLPETPTTTGPEGNTAAAAHSAASQHTAAAAGVGGGAGGQGCDRAAPAAAAAVAPPGGGMALSSLFRSFEECASSILAGALYPGSMRPGAPPAPPAAAAVPPQPAAAAGIAAAGVQIAPQAARTPAAQQRLTLLWQATMAGLLQDIACVFCCTGHGRIATPMGAAAAGAAEPAASSGASSGASVGSNGNQQLRAGEAGIATSNSSSSSSSSEDTVEWLAGLLHVLGPLLHHLAVQQKPLLSKLLVQQVLAAVGPHSSSSSGVSTPTAVEAPSSPSSSHTAAEVCGVQALEAAAAALAQPKGWWARLLPRICLLPITGGASTPASPVLAGCTPGSSQGPAVPSTTHWGPSGGAVIGAAGDAPGVQQLLLGGGVQGAEAAYLVHVHATTWWMDATLGCFDIFCQASMGMLSSLPSSLSQLGLGRALSDHRHQVLTLVLVVVPWVLLMALRPALSTGSRREHMLMVAAACRACCTLAPALGLMPHGAAMAAGLSGSRWQVLAPIVGVGLFRPLQQQVRLRALLPMITMEAMGVCVLLGVYSSWRRALVRASCILVTASLSGTLIEAASRRLFLATLTRQAAAIGPQGPPGCATGGKDPAGPPQQHPCSGQGGSSSGCQGAGAVRERLAERLRRRSQPVQDS